jgi:BNR repeat-like domain
VLVLGGLALTIFLVYHFTVHTIRNRRPLAGPSVVIAHGFGTQSEASFAAEPGRPLILFGALGATAVAGDAGQFAVYDSSDGGAHWRRSAAPRLAAGTCYYAAAQAVAAHDGREYLALLASSCVQNETPYVLVTTRSGPAARWMPLVRVAPRVGRFGFDDGPALALDRRSGRLYLAWVRGVGSRLELVTSTSADRGRTWTKPAPLSLSLVDPHLARVAVEADGAVVVAGIDGRLGLWVSRSTDHGRTFSAPRRAAPLLVNPSADRCALSIDGPLPFELTRCVGPDPTLVTREGGVVLVYADAGDVFAVVLDDRLRPLARSQVNPPDRGKTLQFFPAAAADGTTGALWACWYDSTFDPHAHRVWFTCSHSRDGRVWSSPVRAAAKPSDPNALYTALPIRPSVVAEGRVVRAFWPDYANVRAGLEVLTAPLAGR